VLEGIRDNLTESKVTFFNVWLCFTALVLSQIA